MSRFFCILVVLCGAVTAAYADTIDFNSGVPLGPSSSFVLGGVTFSTVGGAGGMILPSLTPNGTIGLVDGNSPRRLLRADFDGTVDFVSIDLGDFNDDADTLVLRAFSATNVLLGSQSTLIGASFTGMLTLSITTSSIKYVTFGGEAPAQGGSSVLADNLSFGTISSVPEPTSLTLVLLGLAGLRLVRRKGASPRN